MFRYPPLVCSLYSILLSYLFKDFSICSTVCVSPFVLATSLIDTNIAIRSALLISFSMFNSFPAVPLLQLYNTPIECICQSFSTHWVYFFTRKNTVTYCYNVPLSSVSHSMLTPSALENISIHNLVTILVPLSMRLIESRSIATPATCIRAAKSLCVILFLLSPTLCVPAQVIFSLVCVYLHPVRPYHVLIIRIFLDFTTFQKHNCVKGQHDYNFHIYLGGCTMDLFTKADKQK